MPHATYHIRGRVIDRVTGDGVEGLVVEAWDKDRGPDDFLGSDATDASGNFHIDFNALAFREIFRDHRPDLYFRVFHQGDLLVSTEDSVLWNVDSRLTEVVIEVDAPELAEAPLVVRDIYLKIETVEDYSPVAPQDKVAPPMQYGRDCMRNIGHEDGTIPESEVEARALTALVYREYEDPAYLIPKIDKIIEADINEPIYNRRVPGAVIYSRPGERLLIHVLNCDTEPHSFHTHGVEYGIDSDGAWPLGTVSSDGRRSDEICPGETWTYTFDVTDEMIGPWPFHDHSRKTHASINRGLFGGIIVLPKAVKPPPPTEIPDVVLELRDRLAPFRNVARPQQIALRRADKVYHADALEFLGEWLLSRTMRPIPYRPVIHAPVFFHYMATEESKPVFDSGDLDELVGVFEYQFDDEGDFEYFCTFHPVMQGTVEVVPGGPAFVTVNITDGPPMGFSPGTVTVGVGGTVRWENHSQFHHTVTSKDGASMPTHSINGRGFVGNSPTIVAHVGQKIRWYVFNLDIGMNWHNFHPHAQRWRFGNQNIDVRSMGPAESFTVDTEAPPVLLMTDEIERIQDPRHRPENAKLYRLKGDYVFHCHVHHHLMNGMVGLVRSIQNVWLTDEMAENIANTTGLPIDDGTNSCPAVDLDRCKQLGAGSWEEVEGDPEVTFMHSALLPNTQKVLYWGYTRVDQSRLWDYSTPAGSYSSPSNQPADLPGHDQNTSNLWSAEHTFLDTPEGLLLAHGGLTSGQNKSFIFDPTTETWSGVASTTDARFYSTTLTLADGRAITLFGSGSKSVEFYTHGVGWDAPVGFPLPAFQDHQYYPWAYLLPDGRIFIAGPHVPTHRFDPNNLAAFESWGTNAGNRSTGGEKGTSVLLTLRPPNYEPRVIIAGGNLPLAEKTSEIINLSEPVPAWTPLPDLNVARAQQFTSVLLPDGRVFVAGGVSGGVDGGPSEIFDPQDPGAGWQLGPVMQHARLYHSSIILLADGSILAGGDPQAGGLTKHERFFPGYYFVTRPEITNAPTSISYGDPVNVDTPQAAAISEAVLMRAGAVTHGFNMSQRAIECEITGVGANSITIQSPPNGNIAAPGHYLLFILDGNRVPSVGRWVRLTP